MLGARLGILSLALALVACGGGQHDDPECAPGDSQACGTGVHVCSDSGKWLPCSGSQTSGTQQQTTGPVCNPGDLKSCVGSGSQLGIQECNSGGTGYGSCQVTPAQTTTPAPTPASAQCFNGGDINSFGCATSATAKCCAGSTCVNDANLGGSYCAGDCTTGGDCQSGCCVALSNSGGAVCAAASNCGAAPTPIPTPIPTPTPSLLFGTYQLTSIDRKDTNLYSANSGASSLLIETQLCLVLTLLDNGVLIWNGVAGSKLAFDNYSNDVCDVADVTVL